MAKANRDYDEIMTELKLEINDLNIELKKVKRENATIDIKFMDLYRVLEKIRFSESHREAVTMATSILKGISVDHSKPVTPATEPVKVAVPPTPPVDPQKHKRGPKTKESKKGASLFSWIF